MMILTPPALFNSRLVERIKAAIDFYGLTTDDLFGERARGKGIPIGKGKQISRKQASAPKYKDKQTGKTWTGHGMRPAWFKNAVEHGIKPEDMAV